MKDTGAVFAIGRKPDLAVKAGVLVSFGAREILFGNVIQTQYIDIEIMHAIHVFANKIDVVKFQFHVCIYLLGIIERPSPNRLASQFLRSRASSFPIFPSPVRARVSWQPIWRWTS